MKFIFRVAFSTFLFGVIFILAGHSSAYAQSGACATFSFNPNPVASNTSFTLIKTGNLIADEFVRLEFSTGQIYTVNCIDDPGLCGAGIRTLLTIEAGTLAAGTNTATLTYINALGQSTQCPMSIQVLPDTQAFCSPLGVSSVSPQQIVPAESVSVTGCLGAGTDPQNPCNGESRIVITNLKGLLVREVNITQGAGMCTESGEFSRTIGDFIFGTYRAQLFIGSSPTGSQQTFTVLGGGGAPDEGTPCTTIQNGYVCTGTFQFDDSGTLACTYQQSQCLTCDECTEPQCTSNQIMQCRNSLNSFSAMVAYGCDDGPGRVNTAIGCIPFDIISRTAAFFLAWGVGVGGGLALLMVGLSGIMLATSSGNPEKVKGAKDLFWAAITGLGMVILSVFLLRFVGVDVLGLFA